MKTAGGGRDITIVIAVAATVAVAVTAGVLARAHRTPSGVPPLMPEIASDAPQDNGRPSPGSLVDAPLPPFPPGDTPGDARIRELSVEGREKMKAGDPAGAVSVWRALPEVEGVEDRGHLYYLRLLNAHGLTDEATAFLDSRFPEEPSTEMYEEAARFFLGRLRFREAHTCLEMIARSQGEAPTGELADLCYRIGSNPDDMDALKRMAERFAEQDRRPDLARPLLERVCLLDPRDEGARKRLAGLSAVSETH